MCNLQGSEELFRLAVEACPNGMLMIDHAGTIVLVNAAIEQLFGYPREELVGEPVDILVPTAAHRAAFAATDARGRPVANYSGDARMGEFPRVSTGELSDRRRAA